MMMSISSMSREQLEAAKSSLLCEISELKEQLTQRVQAEETEALRDEVTELERYRTALFDELNGNGCTDPEIMGIMQAASRSTTARKQADSNGESIVFLVTPQQASEWLDLPLDNNSKVLFLVSDDLTQNPEAAYNEAKRKGFNEFRDSRLHSAAGLKF